MRSGWTQDEHGFTRVVADWLPLAVSPRGEEWVASIDGQILHERGDFARFKDADLAMRAVELEALGRCDLAGAELSRGSGASVPGATVGERA